MKFLSKLKNLIVKYLNVYYAIEGVFSGDAQFFGIKYNNI